ncbi:MAG TPA: hypothetical protein VJ827_13720 [Rubrobacter sp.]|nr:hypothetical protein [Rubrobacter sp.]
MALWEIPTVRHAAPIVLLDELEATAEDLAPANLCAVVRNLVAYGPRPIEVGV